MNSGSDLSLSPWAQFIMNLGRGEVALRLESVGAKEGVLEKATQIL